MQVCSEDREWARKVSVVSPDMLWKNETRRCPQTPSCFPKPGDRIGSATVRLLGAVLLSASSCRRVALPVSLAMNSLSSFESLQTKSS